MTTGARTLSTTIDAGLLDVHVDGPRDGAPVLLLHGFPQRADCWDAVIPALVDAGYRTIAPDQRGYSPGARPTGRWSYTTSALLSDACAVIDDVAGCPVHVVGHDWGAVVAWRLAARHPERVRTLTAVSVPHPDSYGRAMLGTRQLLASWYLLALQVSWLPERVLGAGGRGFSTRFVDVLRGAGQTRERAQRDAARLADPAALTAAIDWYRGAFLERPRRTEPKIAAPTLFVWSDGDTAITRASTELTDRHVSGPYRYAELRGVSHWIPEEAPGQLADLVLEHLAARPAAGFAG